MAVVGGNTPVRANASFEYEGLTFREVWAMLSLKIQAGLSILLAFHCISFSFSLCFSFSCIDSHIGQYVTLYKLVYPCALYPEDGIMRLFFIHLDSPLFVRSVPGVLAPSHLPQKLKLLEGPLKMRCKGGLPGKATSWIFLSVDFRHINYNFSFYLLQC